MNIHTCSTTEGPTWAFSTLNCSCMRRIKLLDDNLASPRSKPKSWLVCANMLGPWLSPLETRHAMIYHLIFWWHPFLPKLLALQDCPCNARKEATFNLSENRISISEDLCNHVISLCNVVPGFWFLFPLIRTFICRWSGNKRHEASPTKHRPHEGVIKLPPVMMNCVNRRN